MAFGLSSNLVDTVAALRSANQNPATGGISDLPLQPKLPLQPEAQTLPPSGGTSLLRPTVPAPTYGTYGLSAEQVKNFINTNLADPAKIAEAAQQFGITSEDITAATGYTPKQQVNYFEQAGMLPTTSAYNYDLFPELRPGQEQKLERFVNMLALGQELTPNQAAKLTKYGAKTGYDFFNVPTYKSLEEQLLERTGADFNAITSYIGQNIDDPTKIYQRAAELGITPEEVLLAYSATGKRGQSPYSFQQIQDYFETGKAGYNTAFDKLLSDTFGANSVESARSFFKPEDFANKSLESIETFLQNSIPNKTQEAVNFSNVLYGGTDSQGNQIAGLLGYDPTQKQSTFQNLLSGDFKDEGLMAIYNELLKTNKLTPELQNRLMQHLAETNPDAYVFQQNPQALTFYKPLGELINAPKQPGQYGYYNDMPVLSASEADRLLNGEVFQGGNNYFGYGREGAKDDSLGWDIRSKWVGSIANGAGIFNVRATNDDIQFFENVEQQIRDAGGLKTEEGRQGIYVTREDPETGLKYQNFIPVESLFARNIDPETGAGESKYELYQSTINGLNNGAKQLGIDPTKFSSTADLFRAVDEKASNLYVVTGRANKWDPEVSERLGLTGHGKSGGGINHATVLYQKFGDKLIPVELLKTFNFDDPNTSRGVIGDFFQGIASLPFIAEIASVATGGNPMVYAALKGAQTLALGGDLDDALKSAGLAYLTSNFIPKYVTPEVSSTLAQNSFVSSLAQASPELANLIVDGGTRAIISSSLAAITGQDPGEAAINALVSSGLGTLTKEGLQLTNIPVEYRGIVANILSSAIFGQDPTKSLIGSVTKILKDEFKDFGTETVKSDQDKTTKETKI